MPRPNRARSLESEENLQHRIAWEREQRGMTYEGLAKRMTDLGCATHASAIYKIEKGNPPRKVTVSELIALSKVFETTTDELLVPLDLRHAKLAAQIVRRAEATTHNLNSAADELEALNLELQELAAGDPRTYEVMATYLASFLGHGAKSEALGCVWERLTAAVLTWQRTHIDLLREEERALTARRAELEGDQK